MRHWGMMPSGNPSLLATSRNSGLIGAIVYITYITRFDTADANDILNFIEQQVAQQIRKSGVLRS